MQPHHAVTQIGARDHGVAQASDLHRGGDRPEERRWEQAREKLESVVNKSGNTLGYDLIVTLYEKLGLTERARLLRAGAKASGAYRDPADPWLDALMADCHDPYRLALAAGNQARYGDTPGAVLLLERAVAIAPDDVSSRYQLGSLLMASHHEMLHAGQLGLLRRMLGNQPIR